MGRKKTRQMALIAPSQPVQKYLTRYRKRTHILSEKHFTSWLTLKQNAEQIMLHLFKHDL
jgi:hypothetical protein